MQALQPVQPVQPVHFQPLWRPPQSLRCQCAKREVLRKIRPLRALRKRKVLLNS